MSGEQLERRYRRLLRILPKSYREARAEELLSVLMEGAAEGRRWPEIREALSLARLGMRVRMGGEAGGVLVDTRAGAMARLVGITGSMLLAFIGTTSLSLLMRNLLRAHVFVWTYRHPFTWKIATARPYSLNIEHYILDAAAPACWLLVLVLLALGWWQVARVSALALFLWSAYLTEGMAAMLREETVLAGVVTVALFAVRGVHARPARLAGSAAFAVLLGIAYWTAHHERLGPPLSAVMALQGWGSTDQRHAMVMAAAGVAVVAVVGYRSVVWPVALAVVAVAAIGPVLVWVSAYPDFQGSDLVPLAFLTGALVLVAALAVLKDRLAARRGHL